MNLYELVDQGCRHGLHVLVQCQENYMIVSPFRDSDGNWRESYFENIAKNTFTSIGAAYGKDIKRWQEREKLGWQFVRYVSPLEIHKPEPYKIRDLVDVLEMARECERFENWDQPEKDMVGKKGLEVRVVFDENTGLDYYIWNEDKSDYWPLRHEWLAPHVPNTKQDEPVTMIKDGKTYKVKILEEVKE